MATMRLKFKEFNFLSVYSPFIIFISIWVFSSLVQLIGISYKSKGLGFGYLSVVFLSLFSYLVVLCPLLIFLKKSKERLKLEEFGLKINQRSLVKRLYFLFLVSIFINAFNLSRFGLFPVFGFFGFDTLAYNEYGSFLGVIIPISMLFLVISPLIKSKKHKCFFIAVGVITILIYVNRGPLIMAIFQLMILKSMIQPDFISNKKVKSTSAKNFIIIFVFLLFVVFIMEYVGEMRSGKDSLFTYLHIKEAFYDWNVGVVWVLSYLNTPLSNFLWIYEGFDAPSLDFSFFTKALPAFFVVEPSYKWWLIQNTNVLDNTHFYLADFYMSLGEAGIVLWNFALGIISFFVLRRICNPLIMSFFISFLCFSFFVDYFLYFPSVMQVLLAIFSLNKRVVSYG